MGGRQEEGTKLKSQKKVAKDRFGFNANTASQLGNTHKLEEQKDATKTSDRGGGRKKVKLSQKNSSLNRGPALVLFGVLQASGTYQVASITTPELLEI